MFVFRRFMSSHLFFHDYLYNRSHEGSVWISRLSRRTIDGCQKFATSVSIPKVCEFVLWTVRTYCLYHFPFDVALKYWATSSPSHHCWFSVSGGVFKREIWQLKKKFLKNWNFFQKTLTFFQSFVVYFSCFVFDKHSYKNEICGVDKAVAGSPLAFWPDVNTIDFMSCTPSCNITKVHNAVAGGYTYQSRPIGPLCVPFFEISEVSDATRLNFQGGFMVALSYFIEALRDYRTLAICFAFGVVGTIVLDFIFFRIVLVALRAILWAVFVSLLYGVLLLFMLTPSNLRTIVLVAAGILLLIVLYFFFRMNYVCCVVSSLFLSSFGQTNRLKREDLMVLLKNGTSCKHDFSQIFQKWCSKVAQFPSCRDLKCKGSQIRLGREAGFQTNSQQRNVSMLE